MYINLAGGPAQNMPPLQYGGGYQGQQYGGGQQHGGQQQNGQQQYGQQQQQQGGNNNQNEEMEKLARKYLPRILRKLEQHCCVVM